MAPRPRNERGLSDSVQLAVAWPLLVLLIFGIIQAGVWLHGRNVAQRAAVLATDIGRGTTGSLPEARQAATTLAEAGGLTGISVDVRINATTVIVEVGADTPLIVDLGLGRLRETATAPRERLTTP